jgi:hypothetical protein
MASGSTAMLRKAVELRPLEFTCSCQTSAKHFEQYAEFPPLRNRGLGPLAVTVLPISARQRGTAISLGRGRQAWRRDC